jgi:hypothetical protein
MILNNKGFDQIYHLHVHSIKNEIIQLKYDCEIE